MNIQLSDHFTYRRLIRFVIPSVAMMILTSIYGVVDGLFVSNFVGKTPFAAVNLVIPFTMILGAFGFMLGTGGTALVAKTLGEGRQEEANRIFSMLIYFALGLGVLLTIFGIAVLKGIVIKMGADDAMLRHCMIYGRIVLLGIPFYMLQNMFQNFLIAAEKPQLGLIVTIAAGVTNMVLDTLFIAVLGWGVAGAAAATALGQCVGYDAELYRLTVRGFHLYAISFLLCGFNIYGSSFFTALNNGVVSAAISFLRTVVFEVAAILILPVFFGVDGIWCAITVAELASILITIGAFSALRRRYQYL